MQGIEEWLVQGLSSQDFSQEKNTWKERRSWAGEDSPCLTNPPSQWPASVSASGSCFPLCCVVSGVFLFPGDGTGLLGHLRQGAWSRFWWLLLTLSHDWHPWE